ncbi:unnamed protein product [Protopolystoma xenopodis]|uniref:DIS3-like exonuclease 1 n=1 Tax=Protopolystoma xenopodis TaxID=117903 RepID=A0A3S5A666_9PLAT|nr:unnamed protein product [Protopolystoma xenopodis]
MHSTIAELMIFANHWVARRCLQAFPDRACLRRHPPPRPEFFDELRRCAAARGFDIRTDTNLELSRSLAACEDPKNPEVLKIVYVSTFISSGSFVFTRQMPTNI